jgi:integrase/recombinase XerD
MKINGHGQSKVLTVAEIDKLFAWGFANSRDRALFGICLHTGCRISEALALKVNDLQAGYITLRKRTTKGKKATRSIPINDKLQALLEPYLDECRPESFLFPGHHNAKTSKQMTRAAADLILKDACLRVGLIGVSTHSFRRTALTQMHNAGIPLRVIQRISGHSSLAALQRYLEVDDEQIVDAVKIIGSKNPPPRARQFSPRQEIELF